MRHQVTAHQVYLLISHWSCSLCVYVQEEERLNCALLSSFDPLGRMAFIEGQPVHYNTLKGTLQN